VCVTVCVWSSVCVCVCWCVCVRVCDIALIVVCVCVCAASSTKETYLHEIDTKASKKRDEREQRILQASTYQALSY
jgi:hypothetical protein